MGIKYNNPLNGGKYFFLLRYTMTLSSSIIPLSFFFRVTRISRVLRFCCNVFSIMCLCKVFRFEQTEVICSFFFKFSSLQKLKVQCLLK